MTSTLQNTLFDQLEVVSATARRFERQIHSIAWPESDLAPVRSDLVQRMRARVQYRDYTIDNVALADAILDRVCLRLPA